MPKYTRKDDLRIFDIKDAEIMRRGISFVGFTPAERVIIQSIIRHHLINQTGANKREELCSCNHYAINTDELEAVRAKKESAIVEQRWKEAADLRDEERALMREIDEVAESCTSCGGTGKRVIGEGFNMTLSRAATACGVPYQRAEELFKRVTVYA